MKQRERELAKESKVTLETFLARRADSVEAEVLNLVVKSDVQGSLEAITDALRKLSTDKVRINVIHGGTGAVSESDVLLATASNAIIIGFNVRPNPKTKELAEHEKVDIRFYDIIYKLAEEIRSAMEGLLAPVEKEVALGLAEVLLRAQSRTDRRLPRLGRQNRPQRANPPAARRRGGLYRAHRLAAPLQGRRARSAQRLRMRHRHRKLQRHQTGRQH